MIKYILFLFGLKYFYMLNKLAQTWPGENIRDTFAGPNPGYAKNFVGDYNNK